MTEGRFLSDIEADILELLQKKGAMSVPEICAAMPGDEDFIIDGCVERLIRNRRIMIAPSDDRVKRVILGSVRRPLRGGADDE